MPFVFFSEKVSSCKFTFFYFYLYILSPALRLYTVVCLFEIFLAGSTPPKGIPCCDSLLQLFFNRMAAVGRLVKNRKEIGQKEKQYTKQYIKTEKHKIVQQKYKAKQI
jgi:hypothetical protein